MLKIMFAELSQAYWCIHCYGWGDMSTLTDYLWDTDLDGISLIVLIPGLIMGGEPGIHCLRTCLIEVSNYVELCGCVPLWCSKICGCVQWCTWLTTEFASSC